MNSKMLRQTIAERLRDARRNIAENNVRSVCLAGMYLWEAIELAQKDYVFSPTWRQTHSIVLTLYDRLPVEPASRIP